MAASRPTQTQPQPQHSTAQHVGMYPAKASDPAAGAAPVTGFPVGGPAASSQWSSGLLDCFDDCGLCNNKQACTIYMVMHVFVGSFM